MTLPVPRDFWAGKPEGLGLTVVGEAGATGVSAEHSWGPGLVGHLSHDVVFIALPLYALLLAWAFRYMDGRIRFAGRDPMTIALFGSALGQIIAMPRGDIGLFAFNMFAAFSGAWIFGRLVALALLPIDREAEYEMAWEGPEPSDDLDPDEEAMAQASEEERELGSRVPGSQELGSMQLGPAR